MHEVLDNVAERMRERFANIEDLVFLSLMDSENFEKFNFNFPVEAFNALKKSYASLFDFGILKMELEVMYSDSDCYKRSLKDLFEYFLISGLDGALPLAFKLIELFLCIPATSAAVERSCSCLKRIHTFQRNTQSQAKKSHLGLISIEKEFLNALTRSSSFYDDVITDFKNKKDRRLLLDYK
ncbi:hypothetical protein M8J76_007211 [Diaphorina citri]|nr:hypothetical protein M8J75_003121 [Diaphorina citri]KAI5736799.1 hypothetical protein M8J76_007211 [Diaphorina citri]